MCFFCIGFIMFNLFAIIKENIMKMKFVFSLLVLGFSVSFAQSNNSWIQECAKQATQSSCECVYQKMSFAYSGKDILEKDSLWKIGQIDSAYKNQLMVSMKECQMVSNEAKSSAEFVANSLQQTNASSPKAEVKLTQKELNGFKELAKSKKFKKSYQVECLDDMDDFFEKKSAKNLCECSYNQLISDESLLPIVQKAINKKGEADDFEKWGSPLLKNCLSDTFNSEMEKVFVRECKDDFSKKACQCAYNWLTQSYGVYDFIEKDLTENLEFKQKMKEKLFECKK